MVSPGFPLTYWSDLAATKFSLHHARAEIAQDEPEYTGIVRIGKVPMPPKVQRSFAVVDLRQR